MRAIFWDEEHTQPITESVEWGDRHRNNPFGEIRVIASPEERKGYPWTLFARVPGGEWVRVYVTRGQDAGKAVGWPKGKKRSAEV